MGEELEREGMSSIRELSSQLVVDMWTGIRTEWDENADVLAGCSQRSKHSTAAGVCRFLVSFILSGAMY